MGINSSREFLQKRVDYLEEVNRKITSSLEIVKNLANFQHKIGNHNDLQMIFSESTEKIVDLIDFKSIAFLLYDTQNYEFTIEHVYPQFLKSDFLVEVDDQIESGAFAWTLNQKRPVFVKPLQLDDSSELVLHALSTDKMALGIFFGQLKVPKDEILQESFELLTVALNTTSFAVENYKLYSEVDEYSKELERRVKEKTFDVLEVNKKLKGEIEIRKAAEESLKKAKELAEEATESKTEFLTNMSHEIRTPLNAILGMCELVAETELDGEQREYIEVVRASSEGLYSLVNDILDFSRLEAGKMNLNLSDFNLRELIEGVADIFSLQCEKKGIELLYHIPVGTALQVKGDVTRIRQILINLVANAVKFTNTGHIFIKVENGRIKKNGSALFKFSVEDTGIGIAEEHQQKIFNIFSQADNSLARKFGGTGLGLNIVKSLIRLMDGQLNLTSKLGKGCWFTMDINLSVLEGTREIPLLKKESAIILIVDKYEKSRKVLFETLKGHKVKVLECAEHEAPLAVIKKEKVACVIVNCANSMDLVKLIRQDSSLGDLKMILIISKSDLNNLSKVKDSLWLTKPIRERQLLAAIDLINKDVGSYKEVLSLIGKAKTQQQVAKKVLLVEDNLQNQKIITKMLKLGGYEVTLAENGKEAVHAVEQDSFDAVMMDIQMPVMDGFEATEKIRRNEKSANKKKVPIIALTAHAISDYRNRCLTAGMDDYLTKPVKKQVLLDKVESWANRVIIID